MSDMQSVLDTMTAGIHDRKEAKATVLTPVGSERNGPLDGAHATRFPYDDPQTIQDAIRRALALIAEAKAELDHVGGGVIALASLYGLTEVAATTPRTDVATEAAAEKAAVRERERLADEKFDDRFARLKADAQAATFANLSAEADAKGVERPAPPPTAGDAPPPGGAEWQCPTHGGEFITVLKSKRGRMYRACINCKDFEKG